MSLTLNSANNAGRQPGWRHRDIIEGVKNLRDTSVQVRHDLTCDVSFNEILGRVFDFVSLVMCCNFRMYNLYICFESVLSNVSSLSLKILHFVSLVICGCVIVTMSHDICEKRLSDNGVK